MRVFRFCTALLVWVAIAIVSLGVALAQAHAEDVKLEVQLVWATNDDKSPDAGHKPVDADIRRKLQELPLKWTNYFTVRRQLISLPPNDPPKKTNLSDKCAVELKSLGGSKIEVSLFGKGEQVIKRTQSIPKGDTLILGGNAPNSTAWLVVLKRKE